MSFLLSLQKLKTVSFEINEKLHSIGRPESNYNMRLFGKFNKACSMIMLTDYGERGGKVCDNKII